MTFFDLFFLNSKSANEFTVKLIFGQFRCQIIQNNQLKSSERLHVNEILLNLVIHKWLPDQRLHIFYLINFEDFHEIKSIEDLGSDVGMNLLLPKRSSTFFAMDRYYR